MPRGIYDRSKAKPRTRNGKPIAKKAAKKAAKKKPPSRALVKRAIAAVDQSLRGYPEMDLASVGAKASRIQDDLSEIIRDTYGKIRTSNHVDNDLVRRHSHLKMAADHIDIAIALVLRAADL